MRVTKIAITAATILLAATSAVAQNRKPISRDEQNKYVISAKAGVVSVVEGEATVRHFKPFAMPEMLLSGDELSLNDTVRTGTSARVEILLNPGCYLRLDENSEFVFLFDGFASNEIKLLRGSAILEASAIDGLIFVETPNAKFDIVRTGLYRFRVSANGKSEVAVRKGRVLLGEDKIKEGKKATVDSGSVAIASFNKKEVDELDDWSKQRAQTLIAANRKLSGSMMRRSLGMVFVSNTWIYDPFCRCYTFLPFTSGFSSPYGWGYSVCNPYWYNAPRYNNWNGGGGYVGGQPGSGGGSGGGGSNGGGGGGHPTPPPTSGNPGGGGGFTRPERGADRDVPARNGTRHP